MKPIVRIENLSKQYTIGERRNAAYVTLRDTLAEVARSPLSAFRARERRSNGDTIWALRDVDFDIHAGEAVGIIGGNGAGKSTLLKVLSRVTEPTSGRAELYGRIGSLLEVGTGFHPELTGRDNIFLNGAVLGMKRSEIARKFDEIVEFAEISRFIDTPVKRYSSGMYMRLAFAVAAHLEPEILIVDEVLAVGDTAFQRKCLGKMGEVTQTGRTVIFVSHNMTAINQLCSRAVMLDQGQVVHLGRSADVIAQYLKKGTAGGERVWKDDRRAPGNDKIQLRAARIISEGKVTSDVNIDCPISIEVEFLNRFPEAKNLCVSINLQDSTGGVVLSTSNTPAANSLDEDWFNQPHEPGLFRAVCTLPANFLNEGLYYITVHVLTLGPIALEAEAPQVLSFNVFDTGAMREAGGGGKWDGVVRIRLPWKTWMVEPFSNERLN